MNTQVSTGSHGAVARLFIASGAAFIVQAAGAIVAFAASVIIARLLKVEHYGAYIYIATWARLLALPAKLGLDTAALRLVTQYNSGSQWKLLAGFLRRSRELVLGVAIAISVLVVGGMLIARVHLQQHILWAVWLAAILVPLGAVLDLNNAVLRGLKHPILSLFFRDILPRIVLIAIFVALMTLGGLRPIVPVAIAASVLATGILVAVTSGFIRQLLPLGARLGERHFRTRFWLRTSLPMVLVAGSNLLLAQTDVLMVGAIVGTTQAGIYSAAARVAMVLLFGLTSINYVLAPVIADLHALGKDSELRQTIRWGANLSLLITLFGASGIAVWSSQILGLFGAEFQSASVALYILVGAQVINSGAVAVTYLLTMTDKQDVAAKVMVAGAGVNVLLNGLLVPQLGIEGAAISTAVSTVATSFALAYQVHTRLSLLPLPGWHRE